MEFQERIENAVHEYDHKFQQLLQHNQYHAVIMQFKSMLRNKDTFTGSYDSLGLHHLRYIYFTAYSYFMIGDYDHSVAMIKIILQFDPNNTQALILISHALIKQNLWSEANEFFERFNLNGASEENKIEIEKIKDLLAAHDIT